MKPAADAGVFWRAAALIAVLLVCTGCRMWDPEVVVINRLGPQIMVRNPCFNGTVWNTILRYGEATSPDRCLPGDARVHFQRMDAHSYCRRQARYGLVDSLCMCDSSWVSKDTGVIDETPLWFNYKTTVSFDAAYGAFLRVELLPGEIEQDFSAPGPYGH